MGKRLKKQLKQLICELLLNVLHHETGLIKHGEINAELYSHWFTYSSKIQKTLKLHLKKCSSVLNPHCTSKCGTFMFVPHVPQMWYKCGTQMRPHTFFRSQSSILGSQSSLYPKSGVLLSLYPKYPKWGTSGVHKRGLTRFLDDLSIMHLMYVYIK